MRVLVVLALLLAGCRATPPEPQSGHLHEEPTPVATELTDGFRPFKSPVNALLLAPGGDRLLIQSAQEGRLLLTDLRGKVLHEFPVGAPTFVLSADWTLLATSEGETLTVWDLATGKKRFDRSAHRNGISSLALSPDGLALASAGVGGHLALWNPLTGDLVARFDTDEALPGFLPISLAFRPDRKVLYVGGSVVGEAGESGLVVALDPEERTLEELVGKLPIPVHRLEANEKGPRACLSLYDRLYLLENEEVHDVQVEGVQYFSALALDPTAPRVVVGREDDTLMEWVPGTPPGRLGDPKKHAEHPVAPIALSKDGQTIVSVHSEGSVRIWKDGKPAESIPSQEAVRPVSLAVSADGSNVVVGNTDGSVRVFHPGQPVLEGAAGDDGVP